MAVVSCCNLPMRNSRVCPAQVHVMPSIGILASFAIGDCPVPQAEPQPPVHISIWTSGVWVVCAPAEKTFHWAGVSTGSEKMRFSSPNWHPRLRRPNSSKKGLALRRGSISIFLRRLSSSKACFHLSYFCLSSSTALSLCLLSCLLASLSLAFLSSLSFSSLSLVSLILRFSFSLILCYSLF